MARIHVNPMCNVVTGEHSNRYVPYGGEAGPEITVPGLKLRLDPIYAKALADALIEACIVAAQHEPKREGK
jgi:hypothetical protein